MKTLKSMKYSTYSLLILLSITIAMPLKAQVKVSTEKQHMAQLSALKVKRDSTLRLMKEMPVKSLVIQMDKDAKMQMAPFNSSAFREITTNRKSDGNELFKEIENSRETGYISILALRKINPEAYNKLKQDAVCSVLIEQFSVTKSYNMWGLPHLYWEEAAKAIIECGKYAEDSLKKFLADKSPAPVWGSEEGLEYEAYMYRRCDYALALIMAIRGEDTREISKSAEKRDAIIKDLIME